MTKIHHLFARSEKPEIYYRQAQNLNLNLGILAISIFSGEKDPLSRLGDNKQKRDKKYSKKGERS
jgi:hypothetical protein